jgi:hypothetical protein
MAVAADMALMDKKICVTVVKALSHQQLFMVDRNSP